MLAVVDYDLKEHANSIANMCYNLFGYLPAPALYGLMNKFDSGHEIKSNYGMIMILWVIIPSVLSLGVVISIKKQKSKSQ